MHRYDSCRRPPAESRLSRPAGPPAEPPSACGAKEQEHRLKVLFQVLDVNGDGGICVNDLTIGLKKLGVHRTEHELLVSEDAARRPQQPPWDQCSFHPEVHLSEHQSEYSACLRSRQKVPRDKQQQSATSRVCLLEPLEVSPTLIFTRPQPPPADPQHLSKHPSTSSTSRSSSLDRKEVGSCFLSLVGK